MIQILYSISLLTKSLSLQYLSLESSTSAFDILWSQVSRYGLRGIIENAVVG
jgi:hypothetical protein